MLPDRPRLEKAELFARLRQGREAGVTVVTPNLRLARSLARDFDREQASAGLKAWETPDILALGTLAGRLWEDALYSGGAPSLPLLLTPAQEQALWEETLREGGAADKLVALAPAAAQCRGAWKLAHEWRLAHRLGEAQSVDAREFAAWAARYERVTGQRGQTDAARLPDVIAPALPRAMLPASLALFGFDQVTPQASEFLHALAARGVEVFEVRPERRESRVHRVELTEAKDEIDAAARWARARLEADPEARIGIVVPDLARSRARVRRVFARTMRPGEALEPSSAAPAFGISLGAALVDFPIVADALLVLELAGGGLPFERASRVVRSPFIAGAETELGVRARLDARLRDRCGPRTDLDSLSRLCRSPNSPRAALLVAAFDGISEFRDASLGGRKGLSDWAKAFSEVLRIAGFPGERTLDSAEVQALARWHELLGELAAVERVAGKMDYGAALARAVQLARDTIFQPEGGAAPVLVAGILESAGLAFDHLWVMGLTDDAWPIAARPDPFLPVSLQRAAGIPQADPVSSLELDRRITQGWMHAAREVVFSHSRVRGEAELSASPLIAHLPLSDLEALALAPAASLRDAIHRARRIETVDDSRAPPAPAGTVSGGTGLFRDQGACPFRAFAKYRAGCRDELPTPQPGLDAMDRGNIVHAMLAELWRALGSKRRLEEMDAGAIESAIAEAVDKAIANVARYRVEALAGRFGELERERLAGIARDWLAVERERMDFAVAAIEDKKPATFGGVTVNVKLDRMDEVPGVGRFVIDYKTGEAKPSALLAPRMDEPQLAMYALSRENVGGVAFAHVRAGGMEFRGVAKAAGIAPGVELAGKGRSAASKAYPTWNAALAQWKSELESLGKAYAGGDARVDPKRGPATCQQCEQQPFCRIAERSTFGGVRKAEDDD